MFVFRTEPTADGGGLRVLLLNQVFSIEIAKLIYFEKIVFFYHLYAFVLYTYKDHNLCIIREECNNNVQITFYLYRGIRHLLRFYGQQTSYRLKNINKLKSNWMLRILNLLRLLHSITYIDRLGCNSVMDEKRFESDRLRTLRRTLQTYVHRNR